MYIPGTLHIHLQNGSLVILKPISQVKIWTHPNWNKHFKRWVGFRVPGIHYPWKSKDHKINSLLEKTIILVGIYN